MTDVDRAAEVLQETWGCGPGEYVAGDERNHPRCASKAHSKCYWTDRCDYTSKTVAALAAAGLLGSEGLAAAVEAHTRALLAFDCTKEELPEDVDVPDDYERGLHDAASGYVHILTEHRALASASAPAATDEGGDRG